MKKMKLKKNRKFDKINTLIIIIILLFLSIILVLGYFSSKVSPLLLKYAELQTSKLANLIINRAVTKQISNGIDIDKLFSTIQNKDGEIQTIDFNPVVVNKVLNMTTNAVHTGLKAIEQGNIDMVEIPDDILVEIDKKRLKKGIIFEIPLGVVWGNAFLSNLGPRIPVKLGLVGSVNSNIQTKINSYGINNALVEVYIKIEVTEMVNLPIASKSVTVSSDIPVAMKIIEGKIPQYYQNGVSQNSSMFTLPIQ